MIRRALPLLSLTLLLTVTAACASKHDDGGTASPTAPPSSSGSPTASLPPIDAYIIYRDDRGNLEARNFQTGETRNQTIDYNSEAVLQPTCTSDGSRIAYLIQKFSENFRRLDIRGTGAPAGYIKVAANVQGFAWSPDGTKIVLSAWDHQAGRATLSILDVATGQTSDVLTGGLLIGGLSWSPDGERLVYYVQDLNTGDSKINTLELNGGDPREVGESGDLQWLDPVWTPDGEAIIASGLTPESAQLYRIDAESGEATQITTDTTVYRRAPHFSPDGSIIGFTGSIIIPQLSANAFAMMHQFGIFIVQPDGAGETAVTVDPRTSAGAFVDTFLNAYLLGWCKPGPWLDDSWTVGEVAQ